MTDEDHIEYDDFDSVKDEEFYGNVKWKRDGRRRIRHCPLCGNEMKAKRIGRFVFCDKCHCKMPWVVVEPDDKPIKPL